MGAQVNKDHAVVSEANIYHFGSINIHQDMHGHQFFTQSYNFIVDVNAKQQFIEHLLKRNNDCYTLMQIRNIKFQEESYCTNSVKITVAFEYIGLTLQNLIDRNYQFTQSQIIKLFYHLLISVKYLNDNESYHGDICPQFIYIDCRHHKQFHLQSGDHIFKIFDSAYFQPTLNGYYRAQKEKTYNAPQVLNNIGEKRVYPLYNHHTAETFSIGLVVLQCMSQVSPLGAYNNKFQIDFYYIESMFRLAQRKGFNESLIGLVRECLQSKNRHNASQILAKFEKYNLGEFIQTISNKFSLKKIRNINNANTSYNNSR